jgi:hypothetical protein
MSDRTASLKPDRLDLGQNETGQVVDDGSLASRSIEITKWLARPSVIITVTLIHLAVVSVDKIIGVPNER